MKIYDTIKNRTTTVLWAEPVDLFAGKTRLPPSPDPLARLIDRKGGSSGSAGYAAILSQSTGKRPARARQSLLRLQQQYGNRYVQRVVALARQDNSQQAAAPALEQAIQRARGGGQALDSQTRTHMESAFGANFSGVRVHTDSQADSLNRSLNARAFTTGQDIFFRQGAYAPASSGGQELLAHELTHVVQQRGHQIQPKLTVGQPGDRYEQEAERMARVVTGPDHPSNPSVAIRNGVSYPRIQRQGGNDQEPPTPIEPGRRGSIRREVDQAVRSRFGLSGSRLTPGRVEFLSQAQFGQRFPAAQIPELLLNRFLTRSGVFGEILRYYGYYTVGIERMRRFIAERMSVGYFEFRELSNARRPPHLGQTVTPITPTELLAQHIAGFTTAATSRAARQVLIQAPGNIHTLVHETCHFYTHNNFNREVERRVDPNKFVFGIRLSEILNEGFTEYFTRQVMRAHQQDFGNIDLGSYPEELDAAWRFIVTIGEQTARQAYFRGDRAAINRLFQAIQLNEQFAPLLVPDFMLP